MDKSIDEMDGEYKRWGIYRMHQPRGLTPGAAGEGVFPRLRQRPPALPQIGRRMRLAPPEHPNSEAEGGICVPEDAGFDEPNSEPASGTVAAFPRMGEVE